MTIRTVKYELEARLNGRSGRLYSKPSGKLEFKQYDDNGTRLKVSVRNLQVPEQTMATVMAGDSKIAELEISHRKGRLDIEPADIPDLLPRQVIRIIVDGNTLLEGKLYED